MQRNQDFPKKKRVALVSQGQTYRSLGPVQCRELVHSEFESVTVSDIQ